MPNSIKYSTTGDTFSLRKGNLYFGVGDVGKGPSSSTLHYQGISPPTNGWTIYADNGGVLTTIYCANNDFQLINFTNGFSNQNFSTTTECLNWYNSQSSFACVNRDYETISTNGLVMCVDAGFTASYSTSGSSWYDVSLSGGTATLQNSPTYSSSSGGIITFSKTSSQYATLPNIGSKSVWTCEVWVRFSSSLTGQISSVITNQFNGASSLNFSIGTNNAPSSYNIVAGFFDGAWRNTTGFAPTLNTWYQIAGTYDGSTIRQYVNGSASGGTLNYAGTPTSGGQIRMMGRWDTLAGSGNYIDGDLAIARIYNRALTDAEILQNFNAQKGRFGL